MVFLFVKIEKNINLVNDNCFTEQKNFLKKMNCEKCIKKN